MKKIALVLAVFLGAAVAGAADVDALINAARSAPGEFAADALIRIAGTDAVDKVRKIELLETAFAKASEAQLRYPRHAAPLTLDGSSGYWNRLYKQDLDALTLRLRVVEAMLPLDSARAKDWFIKIPPPELPRLTCEDFMVYDVARYYDVLGSVARLDADPLQILRKYAAAVTSPVQLAPMARVLVSSNLKDPNLKDLLVSFGAAMGKVSGDDRSFSFSALVGREIQALVEECNRRKISPLPLIEGYRLYLVVNFSGVRCADGDRTLGQQSFGVHTGQVAEQGTADFVSFFNEKLRMAPLAPIQELEITPSRLEGTVAPLHYCEDAACKAFVEKFRGLVFGENGMPIPPAERNTAEWQTRLKARLTALAEWKAGKDTKPAEYFREKSGAYSELLSLAQNGPNRELVLRAYLDFVNQNPFQKANRAEWFLPVNALVGRVALDSAGLNNFAEELKKAKDPIIQLYANLESVAPRSADKILPLL